MALTTFTEFKGKLLRPGRPPENAEYIVYPHDKESIISWSFDSPAGEQK